MRASDLFFNTMAVDDRAEAKVVAPSTTLYVDNFADIVVTPIYFYQSVPVTTTVGTVIKYLQYIRSEVLNNARLLTPYCALDRDFFLWSWGSNTNGQLGNNSTTASSVPVSVVGNYKFNQVVSTQATAFVALDSNGFAWSWGLGTNGRLGIYSDTNNRSSPVSVVGGNQFVTVGGSDSGFISALDMSGFAWMWGSGSNGNLGIFSDTNDRSSPVSVLGGLNFVQIESSAAIDVNNNCWAWGNNSTGNVGDGTTTNRSSPVAMLGLPGTNGNTVQISSASGIFTLMLTSDGYCYSVGDNTYGELGDGTTTSKSSPVSVVGGKKFIQIAASLNSGNGVAFGLDDTGILWGWGNNANGILDDGTSNNRSSPISVRQGTRKFVQIDADTMCVAATDTDGNIWTWGGASWSVASSNPLLLPGGMYGQIKKY